MYFAETGHCFFFWGGGEGRAFGANVSHDCKQTFFLRMT